VWDLRRKTAEGIAYLHDQERQGLQKFVGQVAWAERPLLTELARQVGANWGSPTAWWSSTPRPSPRRGRARGGCGRLGKIDNCQVAISLGYASRVEHALVDCRLYLPREWAKDGERRAEGGVPKAVRFRTRHELALQMLEEHGPVLPHAWVTGDDEMGRCGWFRRELRGRGEQYLLAVPGNTTVRGLAAPAPPYTGHGRRPRVPFTRVDHWCAALPAEAWETIEVRHGEKGPLLVQVS